MIYQSRLVPEIKSNRQYNKKGEGGPGKRYSYEFLSPIFPDLGYLEYYIP